MAPLIEGFNYSYQDNNDFNMSAMLAQESINATNWLLRCNETEGFSADSDDCKQQDQIYDFQIIKVIVLIVIVIIVLLAICRMVFGLFVHYSVSESADR